MSDILHLGIFSGLTIAVFHNSIIFPSIISKLIADMRPFLFLCFLITSSLGYGQLPDGSISPDFDLPDIDGNDQHLYDYLDDGYGAILDMAATWCPPCWSYHNSGTLESVWEDYGPDGTDEMMVFFLEVDPGTSEPCIYGSSGCSGGSIGDWTNGVEYPIINPGSSGAAGLNNDFDISFFPTIYVVGPNYKIYEVGQLNTFGWSNWVESFTLEGELILISDTDCTNQDIELEVSGGYGSLSYEWSDGSTGSSLIDAPEGTYSVEIFDSNGYSIDLGPIEIGGGDGISVELESIEDVSCYQGDDGSIEVSAVFGSGSYSYEWDNDETGSMITGLESGEYTVTATDLFSLCSSVETYEIEEQDEFEIDVTTTPADCNGENGSMTLDVSGGQGNLNYFLNGSFVSGPDIDEIDAGSYTIFVNDALGCNTSETVEITQPLMPVADTIVPDMLTCQYPSIELNADSSTVGMHIIYRWMLDSIAIDTGLVVQTDTFGLFTLIVEDTLSTCNDSLSFVVDVDTLQPGIMTAVSNMVLTCDVEESLLEGAASTTDIESVWMSSDGNIVSESLQATITTPDTYTLSVTDTLNGCLSTEVVTIEQDLTTPTIELLSIGTLDCETTSTEISTIPTEGTTYQWSRNGAIIMGATESTISVSEIGEYTLEAQNIGSGCTEMQSYTIESATDLPMVELSEPEVLTCSQTSTIVDVNQEDDYIYTWMDNEGQVILVDETTFTISDPGTYSLEVSNILNNCTTTTSFLVEEDISSPSIAFATADILDCVNTSVALSVLEGENVTYDWSTDAGSIISVSVGASIEVDRAAVYTVVATNLSNGCTSTSFIEVMDNLDTPEVSIAEPERLTCDRAEVLLESESVEGVTYEWSTSNGSIVGVNDESQLRVNAPGNYRLVTTNEDNGCSSEASVVVEESVDIPTINLLDLGTILCDSPVAAITLEANDNNTYQWSSDSGTIVSDSDQAIIEVSEAGTYTVVVLHPETGCTSTASYVVESSTDIPEVNIQGQSIACSAETVQLCSSNEDDNLAWYVDGQLLSTDLCIEVFANSEVELFATNDQGCEGSSQFVVDEYDFPDFTLEADDYTLSCIQSEVTINYAIEDQDQFSAVWRSGQMVVSQGNTAVINEPGLYTIEVVSNQTGCIETMEFEVGIDDTVAPVSGFVHEGQLAATFTDESTGQVEDYLWSFGDGNTSTDPNPTYTYQLPGYYEVCLTVSNFCGSQQTCETILAADPIIISESQTDLNCYEGGTGEIALSLDAGLAPYEVEWTGPGGFTANGTSISNLQSGEYQALVTDQGITSEVLNFTIIQPAEMVATAVITDSTVGLSDGEISVEVNGGSGQYQYLWDNGSMDSTISNLEEGTYSVMITDGNDCTITEDYMVNGIISSTSEVSWARDISISPNPSDGRFTLILDNDQLHDARIDVIDASGIQVLNSIGVESGDQLSIDLSSHVTSGMYLIRITKSGESVIKKIAIVK